MIICKPRQRSGFTLIEMSIVLVIIALIIGGILTGQHLIKAAEVRSTLAQIEKYNTAVNTFRGKYGGLPGDLTDPPATQFGFIARGLYAGEGDGNGIVEGMHVNAPGGNAGWDEPGGESPVFWVDLSTAGLIDGGFSTAKEASWATFNQDKYFPPAKLGGDNYIYVWSGGYNSWTTGVSNGINYFGISTVNGLNVGYLNTMPGLSVWQAYTLDQKVDDGYPQSGRAQAMYLTHAYARAVGWAGGGGVQGAQNNTAGTSGSSTTCYDNGGVANATLAYSTSQSGGTNVNCALSFQFQ